MEITPNVNLLKSLRGERIDYVSMIGEGIDNAFDAGATQVKIQIGEDEISFVDDGSGITPDRIKALFSLGEHGPMTTTTLGRFGVGIKSHAVNAGDLFRVVSVSRSGKLMAEVNWRDVLRAGSWSIADPRLVPSAVGAPTGTTITISALRKPPKIGIEKIKQEVALRFFPAIVAGRRIIINAAEVEMLPEPELADVVERQLVLSDGRCAHLRAGVLVRPSRLHQMHVAYGHRVIMPASSLGCGGYSGLRNMFGRLQLSGPWHFAKFKDDLTDEAEREELEEAVFAALKPILDKCNSTALSAKILAVSNLLNERIPPTLAAARPRRQKEKTGDSQRKSATANNGDVAPDKSDIGGPAKTKRTPRDQLIITFDGSAAEDGVGFFQPGRPQRVNLSKDDPHVARLIEHRDQQIGVDSLYALAMSIYEQGRQEHQPQAEFAFEKFGLRIARLLALQSEAEQTSGAA